MYLEADTSSEEWIDAAYAAIRWCAVHHRTFTNYEIWRRFAVSDIKTLDGRALGPVLLRAERQGLIHNTGRVRASRLAHQHGRPVAIWESLIDWQ